MIALGFFLVAVLYISVAIFLAWLLARGFQSRRAKGTVVIPTLLVFALIPTWDIIPGRLYFDHLCETEGGVEIYTTVEGVEGFYGADIGAGSASHFLKTIGYSYIEGRELGEAYRFSLSDVGRLDKSKINEPSAPYIFAREQSQLPLRVIKHEAIISDRRTREVVAVKTNFYWAGNWIQVRSSPLLGGGEYCRKRITSTDFLMSTLKPE